MRISRVHVYDVDEGVRASKLPMSTDPDSLNSEITDTVRNLGRQPRGSAHDNFLHGIVVTFDLTCSNKMWVEFERYHHADITSGQSTMHRIEKLLDGDSPFNDYVSEDIINIIKKIAENYHADPTPDNYLRLLYNIPSGIELTDHIVTNYGQLKTMWYQRHNHRLPEWRFFCDWILDLPKFSELTGIERKKEDGKN